MFWFDEHEALLIRYYWCFSRMEVLPNTRADDEMLFGIFTSSADPLNEHRRFSWTKHPLLSFAVALSAKQIFTNNFMHLLDAFIQSPAVKVHVWDTGMITDNNSINLIISGHMKNLRLNQSTTTDICQLFLLSSKNVWSYADNFMLFKWFSP